MFYHGDVNNSSATISIAPWKLSCWSQYISSSGAQQEVGPQEPETFRTGRMWQDVGWIRHEAWCSGSKTSRLFKNHPTKKEEIIQTFKETETKMLSKIWEIL